MKTEIKRFRVFDIEEQKLVGKFDTIAECVKALTRAWNIFNKKPADGGNPYLDFFVEDIQEDVEVNWLDLMTAWDEGERPEDLSMF